MPIGQTAHFDADASADPFRLRYSANALLPPEIRILGIEPAASDFHARYSAIGKVYHYHLAFGENIDPTKRLYRTPIFGSFDLSRLKTSAALLIGTHDFRAFSNHASKGTASRDSIRTLFRLDAIEEDQGLRLEFEGDGFLYKMVRNIAGTLIDVAAGRIDPEAIRDILAGKDRRRAGWSAPAQGLFLMQVKYPLQGSHLQSDAGAGIPCFNVS